MKAFSLYLHIPFCRRRCSYCDFNTCAGREDRIEDYLSAILVEIEKVAAKAARPLPVHTVYFGGGTPSLLTASQVDSLLQTIARYFVLSDDAEVTLEANPGTVGPDQLHRLRLAGVNRLSFGMQSAHADELVLLQRLHDTHGVIEAVKWARQAGFDNLSLDLIYGLPDQPLARWQATLETAIRLGPEHLSLYALTLEPGTRLYDWAARGLVNWPDDDLAADMVVWAMQRLEEAGFRQYEISNWARAAADGSLMMSRHNLQYWRNQPYLGFGAGAHGSANGVRTANVADLELYLTACQEKPAGRFPAGPAVETILEIDRTSEMQETMMVGLRLTEEGVSQAVFLERFGEPMQAMFGREIEELIGHGLLEWTEGDRLRLTRRGRMLGNQAFMHFV